MCLIKTQASFDIRIHIKGRVSGLPYNELCQIHRTSAMPKTSGFGWHKKFQDGFTNFRDGFHPGHPKTIVTNVNTASVVGLIDLQ